MPTPSFAIDGGPSLGTHHKAETVEGPGTSHMGAHP